MSAKRKADNILEESRAIWDHNAEAWDARIGGGGGFQSILIAPTVEKMLDIQAGESVLDIACGNGIFSRRLAELGASVVASDFSPKLIELAKQRTTEDNEAVEYHVVDATNEAQLLALGGRNRTTLRCGGLPERADGYAGNRAAVSRGGKAAQAEWTLRVFDHASVLQRAGNVDAGGTARLRSGSRPTRSKSRATSRRKSAKVWPSRPAGAAVLLASTAARPVQQRVRQRAGDWIGWKNPQLNDKAAAKSAFRLVKLRYAAAAVRAAAPKPTHALSIRRD